MAAVPASHFEILIIRTLPENRVLKGDFHRAAASVIAIVSYLEFRSRNGIVHLSDESFCCTFDARRSFRPEVARTFAGFCDRTLDFVLDRRKQRQQRRLLIPGSAPSVFSCSNHLRMADEDHNEFPQT